MTDQITDVLERIYAAIAADNEGLDPLIAEAKGHMRSAGLAELNVDPSRLAQNNRQGRKLMQAYFRQRGVKVAFDA